MTKLLATVVFSAALLSAAPFVINGVPYVPTTPSEVLSAPFTSDTGVGTSNQYHDYVLVTVAGTGQSVGTAFNDAFYVFTDQAGNPVAPVNDADFYQVRFSTAPMAPLQPGFDAKNFIVYDVGTGTQVAPPYVPAYNPSHNYSFVVPVGGLNTLYFGVSDGIFSDNSGGYRVSITQLAGVPEPSSLALAACGAALVIVRRRRRG